ncbi:tyrosine-type recombinase/integrase [Clostridium sardiniense]|uniref:tyrosine-type recombinase/integrase n=1 Tax=Clostridium sardiniense TaxID=29369 RepID=UPI00311CD6A5
MESIDKYLDLEEYIFKSREGENKPLSRQQVFSIFKNAAISVSIESNIGPHSLRKTRGYFAWKKGFNPALIMETLNHSNLNITIKIFRNTAG